MCWRDFFESRFHAYTGMTWYFGIFVVVNIYMASWGFSIISPSDSKDRTGSSSNFDCEPINKYVELMGSCCIVEAVISAGLSAAFLVFMRGFLISLILMMLLFLYGILMLTKTSFLIMGAIWLSPKDYCLNAAPDLVNNGDHFFNATLGVMVFQWCLGSYILLSLGLHHAIQEAVHYIKVTWIDDYEEATQISDF